MAMALNSKVVVWRLELDTCMFLLHSPLIPPSYMAKWSNSNNSNSNTSTQPTCTCWNRVVAVIWRMDPVGWRNSQ